MISHTLVRPDTPTPLAEGAGLVANWLPEANGNDAAALHRLAAGPPRRLGELVTDVYPGARASRCRGPPDREANRTARWEKRWSKKA